MTMPTPKASQQPRSQSLRPEQVFVTGRRRKSYPLQRGTPLDGSPVWRGRIRTSAAWRRRVAQTGTSRMELDARRLELALAAGSSGRPSRLAPPAPGDGDLRLHVRHFPSMLHASLTAKEYRPTEGLADQLDVLQVSFTLGLSAWIACAARLNEVGPRPQGWCLHRDTGPTCQPSFPPSRRLAGCPPISAIWWKLPRQAEGVQPFAQGGGVFRPGRLGVAVEEVRRALVRLNLRWGPRPRRVVEGAQGRAPPAGPSQPAGTLPNAAQAMSRR